MRSRAPKQQRREIRPAVRFETADFAVEHCRVCANGVDELLGELRPLRERVAVARQELAAIATDLRQGPEAVEFRLEEKVRVIERIWNAEEKDRRQNGDVKTRAICTDIQQFGARVLVVEAATSAEHSSRTSV